MKKAKNWIIAVPCLLLAGLFAWATADGQTYTAPQANFTLPKNGGTPVAASGGSTPTGTGFTHITGGVQDGASKVVDVSSADVTGTLAAARFPALTGAISTSAGSLTTTCVTCVTTLNKTTTDTTFSNSAAEQTIYTFSVPGGSLGTTSALRLRLDSSLLNNTGVNRTVTLRVKYGATTIFQDVSQAIVFGATTVPVVIDLLLHSAGTTGTQRLTGRYGSGDSSCGGPTTGIGQISSTCGYAERYVGGTSAIDSTASQTLAVTVQIDAATATFTWHTYAAYLELIP